jgi:hypothetical protein
MEVAYRVLRRLPSGSGSWSGHSRTAHLEGFEPIRRPNGQLKLSFSANLPLEKSKIHSPFCPGFFLLSKPDCKALMAYGGICMNARALRMCFDGPQIVSINVSWFFNQGTTELSTQSGIGTTDDEEFPGEASVLPPGWGMSYGVRRISCGNTSRVEEPED